MSRASRPIAAIGRVGFRSQTTYIAGWSSPVAREAHNLEVAGSNPVPAIRTKALFHVGEGLFRFWAQVSLGLNLPQHIWADTPHEFFLMKREPFSVFVEEMLQNIFPERKTICRT